MAELTRSSHTAESRAERNVELMMYDDSRRVKASDVTVRAVWAQV